MEYRSLIFYLALFLIVGSVAEIYVRSKDRVKVERNRQGKIIPYNRRLRPPILLLIAAIIIAVAAHLRQ